MDHSEGSPEGTNEAEASQVRSEAKKSSAKQPVETITVGEAAKILGVSASTVQRRCEDWERNPRETPRPGIAFIWTMPPTGRLDSAGRPITGRRRLLRESVMRYKRNETRYLRRVARQVESATPADTLDT